MEKIKVQSVDNHKNYDLNNFSLNNNSKQVIIDESNQLLLKSEETQKAKIKTEQEENDKNYGNEEFRKGFDAAAKADLLKAEVHQQAKRIKKIKDLDALKVDQLCECCGLPIQGELYQICGKDSELIDLGVGFPLYFYFLKYITILLCLCFLLLGVILWAMCLNKSKDIPDGIETGYIVSSSVGAYYLSNDSIPSQFVIINVILIFFVLLSVIFIRSKSSQKSLEMDIENIGPSDYTVWIKNLGPNIDPKKLVEFLQEHGRSDHQKPKIIKVNFPYYINDRVKVARKYKKYHERLEFVKEYMEDNNNQHPVIRKNIFFRVKNITEEQIKQKLEQAKKDLEAFEKQDKQAQNNSLQIQQAFVTFATQGDARSVADKYGGDPFHRFMRILGRKTYGCLFKDKYEPFAKNY